MAAREKKPAVGKQLGNRKDADSSKNSLTVSTIKKFNSLADAKKDLLKLSEDVASATKKPVPGAYVRQRKNSVASVASVAASEPGVGINSRNLLRSSSKINPRVVAKKSGIRGSKITRSGADSLVTNGITLFNSPYGMRSGSKALRSGKLRDGKGLIEFGERPLEYSLKKRRITVGPTVSASVPTSANTTPSQTPPSTPVVKSAPNSEPSQQSRPRLLLTELPKTQPLISFDSPSQFLRRNSDSAGGGGAGSLGGFEGADGPEVDGPDPVLGRAISSKITALIKRSKATAILQKFSEMRAERKAAEAAASQMQAKAGDCDKPVDTNSNVCTGSVSADTANKNISPAARGTVTKKTFSEGQKTSNLVNQKSSTKIEVKDVSKTIMSVKEMSPKTGSKDVLKMPVPVKEVSAKIEGKVVPKTPVAGKEVSAKTEGKAVPKTLVAVKEESPKTAGKDVLKTSGAVKESTAKTEGKNAQKTPVVGKESSAKMESKDPPKKTVAVKESSVKTESKNAPKTPVAVKETKPQPLKSAMLSTNVKSAGSTVNCKQKETTPVFASTMKPISPVKSKSPGTKDAAVSGKAESAQDTDTEGEPGEPSFPPEGRVRPGMPRPDTPRPKFDRSRVEPTKKLAVRRLEVSEGLGVALGGTAVPPAARVTRKRKLGNAVGSEAGERAAKRKRLSPVSAAAMRRRLVRAGPSGVVGRAGSSGVIKRARTAIIKRARGRPFVRAAALMVDVRRTPSSSPEKPRNRVTVKKSEEASSSKQVPKTDAKLKTDLPDGSLDIKGEKLLNGDLSPGKQLVDHLKNKLSKFSEEKKADIKELKHDPGTEYKPKKLVNELKEQGNISLKSSKECDYLCLKNLEKVCKPRRDLFAVKTISAKVEDSPEKGKNLMTKVNAVAKDVCVCKLPCSKEAKYAPDESSLKLEKKETVFCNKITDTKDVSKKGCVNSVAEARAATKDVIAVVVKESEDVVMKEVEDSVMRETDVPLVSDVNEDCVKMDVVCDDSPKVELKETENSSSVNSPINNNVIESPIKKTSCKSVSDNEVFPCASYTKEITSTKLLPAAKISSTKLLPHTNVVGTDLLPVTEPASSALPPVTEPASSALPPVTEPASSALPPVTEPASSALPPVTEPVSSELPPATEPASSELPPATEPASSGLPPATEPASSGLPPATEPASSGLPPATEPASSGLPPATEPASSGLPPAAEPVSAKLPPVTSTEPISKSEVTVLTNDEVETVPSETAVSVMAKEMNIDTNESVALKIPEGKRNLTSENISTSSSEYNLNATVVSSLTEDEIEENLPVLKRARLSSVPDETENEIGDNVRTVPTESQVSNSPSAVPVSSTVLRVADDRTAKVTALPVNTVLARPVSSFAKFPQQSRFQNRTAGKCVNRRRSFDPCSKQRLLYKDMLGQMRLHRKRSLSEGARMRLLQKMRKSSSGLSAGRRISADSGEKAAHSSVSRVQGDIPVANMCITNYLVAESDTPVVSKTEAVQIPQAVEHATSKLATVPSPAETEVECSEVEATTAVDETPSKSSASKEITGEASIASREAVDPKSESVPPDVIEEPMDTSVNTGAISVDDEGCGNITDGITDTENSLTSVEEQFSDLTPTEVDVNNAFSFVEHQQVDASCTESALDIMKEVESDTVKEKSVSESESVEPSVLMNAEATENNIVEDVSLELPKESALLDDEIKTDELFMDIEALSSCGTGELASFGTITGDTAPSTDSGTEQEQQLSSDVKCVLEEILDRIAKNESGGDVNEDDSAAVASEGILLGVAPEESEPATLPEATPEEQAEKVSILWALGLTMRHAVPPPPPVPKSAPYTGTLKTVIKVQRSSPEKRRRSLKMVLKQGSAPNSRRESGGHESGEEKVEYRICKENELLSGDPTNFGVNNKKLVKNSSHKSFHGGKDDVPTAASGVSSTEGVSNGAVAGKDDVAKPPVDLIIPEKSASFSIHPGRLCSDVCSYCFGKFGSLDTPCHIAQLKTAERQRKVLEIETHLTAESCLCDACYRHVDRKANCPSYKDSRKRYQRAGGGLGGGSVVCAAQGCDQTASHHVRRKWLLKLKRSIANKVPVDTDKPQAHFALCSQHFSWVDFYMVCGICNRRLARAHMYSLGNAEARELNTALTRDGIPARVSSERFLCKLCRYYASLRAKCRNPNNLTGNQKMFFDSYRKRILQYHDIEVPSGSETEEAPQQSKETNGQSAQQQSTGQPKPKRRRTKADSSAAKETQEAASKGGDSAANNSARLEDQNGTSDGTAQQGSSAVMMDYSNLATFGNNLTVTPIPASSGPVSGRRSSSGASGTHHTTDEDQPPPVQASFEFHGAGGAPRGGGEWEQCTASLQFTADTKRLFQTLQRPYGSHSSFMRHLLLLEKYWRQGDLVLSPRASQRAATYVSSVQHRLRAFDYNPLQNTSRPQHKPLAAPTSASDPVRRGLVTETNSVSVIPMGASGEPEPHVLELPLRSPPATATPLAVQGPHIVSRSPGANSGMRKVILDGKSASPSGGYMLSVGRGGVLVPTSVMQVGGRTYLYTPPSISNARRVPVAAAAAPTPVTAAPTGRPVTSPNTSGGSSVVPRISSVRSLAPRAWDRTAGPSSSSSSTTATTTVSTKSSQPRLSVTVVPKSGTASTALPKGSVPGPKPSTIVTPTGIVLSRNLDVTMSPVPPQ